MERASSIQTLANAIECLQQKHFAPDERLLTLFQDFVDDLGLQREFFQYAAVCATAQRTTNGVLQALQHQPLYPDLDAELTNYLLRLFIEESGRARQFFAYAEAIESGFKKAAAYVIAKRQPIIERLPGLNLF